MSSSSEPGVLWSRVETEVVKFGIAVVVVVAAVGLGTESVVVVVVVH